MRSPYYTKKDDFVEVRELVPQIKFFDAPGEKTNLQARAPVQQEMEAEAPVQQAVVAGAEWQIRDIWCKSRIQKWKLIHSSFVPGSKLKAIFMI